MNDQVAVVYRLLTMVRLAIVKHKKSPLSGAFVVLLQSPVICCSFSAHILMERVDTKYCVRVSVHGQLISSLLYCKETT